MIGYDGSRAFVSAPTGTENYSYQLLKALSKIDKKNQYIVYLRPSCMSTLAWQDWPKNFRFKKVLWPRLWTQAGLAVQTFRDQLDVLFVPAHTLPLIRHPKLKTVVAVHDLGSKYLPSFHQLKQRLYLGFMQRFQLQTATKIIAVSKATKEDLVKKIGIEPDKISVVYEGYNKDLFKPIKKDTLVNSLRQYGLKPKRYFLFVGTIQPRKNLHRLIEAFANAQHFLTGADFAVPDNLVLVGSKGWFSDEIYNLPKKLGIEDRVKFLGYVPEKDLPYFYSGAAALTFPSLFEGFGLTVLEAQACGCPVLTSNLSSMPEVGGEGAVYVNPDSIDDIVKGMGQIINVQCQPRYNRGQMIQAGFENIKRFSWEKCARETLEVLEKV